MRITTPLLVLSVSFCSTCLAKADAGLQTFAENANKAFAAKNARSAAGLWDFDAFMKKVMGNNPAPASYKQGFKKGLGNGFMANLYGGVFRGTMKQGSYTVLHSEVRNRRRRVIARLLTADGNINYHDYLVSDDASPKFVDMYIYLTGEYLSRTIRRIYLRGLISQGTNSAKSEHMKSINAIERIGSLNKQRQFKEAWKTGRALPLKTRKAKIIQIQLVTAAQNLGVETYKSALAEYLELYPEDPSTALMGIDAYFLIKDYDRALACVNRLDKNVRDNRLDIQRCNIMVEKGDYDEVVPVAKRAITNYPEEPVPYVSILYARVHQKKFDRAIIIMNAIEKKFPVNWNQVLAAKQLGPLLKSKNYKIWHKKHPQAPKPRN